MFPAEYTNRIFIAEHSTPWNRSKKSGYRVMQAKVENGRSSTTGSLPKAG
jgi:glucose/arabinose dehydrogenase